MDIVRIGTEGLTTPKKQEAYVPASSTVEAALVMPLFLYGALAVIYIFQILAVRARVQMALYEDVRQLAGLAYTYERTVGIENNSTALSTLSAMGLLIKELGTSYGQEHYIVGGNAGFIMTGNICRQNSVIELQVSYGIKNPFDIFGIGHVWVVQKCKTDAWLGEDWSENGSTDNSSKEEQVFVTAQGEVYHTNRNCTYLTRVVYRKNFSEQKEFVNADGGTYYPCEKCDEKENNSPYIYVTQYGNRYHKDVACSQLARTVMAIPKSKVGDRRLCTKCGGQ